MIVPSTTISTLPQQIQLAKKLSPSLLPPLSTHFLVRFPHQSPSFLHNTTLRLKYHLI